MDLKSPNLKQIRPSALDVPDQIDPPTNGLDTSPKHNSLAHYFSDESKIIATTPSNIDRGPPDDTQEPPVVTQTHKQTYYRRPAEPIGKSLYRDHLNRQQRHKIAEFAADIKAKMHQDAKHTAPLTDQLLTEKLEREIDTLLHRWLGKKITHISKQTVGDLLTNLGVFFNYTSEKRPSHQLKDMQDRYDKEQAFLLSLWEDYLYSTIPSSDLSSTGQDQVRLEVFSEVLKVLLSPFMRKSEKVLLLMTIQQLFLQTGNLLSEYELMKDVVEPFTRLYGGQMYENSISELVTPKRDIAKEAYEQCTFKPQANNSKNNKLAQIRYQKDLEERNEDIIKERKHSIGRHKSPTKSNNRLTVLYLDGKKNRDNADKMARDLENLKLKNCTFKPVLNQNYKTIEPRLLRSPDFLKKSEFAKNKSPKIPTETIKFMAEMQECSFTPRINRSPVTRSPTSPRGFDESVQRMRIALQDRSVKKKMTEEVGKPRLGTQHFTQEGLTAVLPFSFYTENRPQRLKCKRLEESKSASTLPGSRAHSPSKSPYRGMSPQRMSPYRKRTQPVIPQQQQPQVQQPQVEASKLFDVDVKIAKDKVVRIEMTDQDDPWTISKFFQQQYGLSNEATAALFELLQNNFDTELQRRNFGGVLSQIQEQEQPQPIEEEDHTLDQDQDESDVQQQQDTSGHHNTSSAQDRVVNRAEDIVSTGAHTHISEVYDESSHSDDDNCDVLSDNQHLDESERPRF